MAAVSVTGQCPDTYCYLKTGDVTHEHLETWWAWWEEWPEG